MESKLKQVNETGAASPDARIINVGTRKSELALIQTNLVIKELTKFYNKNLDKWKHLQDSQNIESHPEPRFNVIPITTKGDEILDTPLPKIGAKSLFTKELETALLEGKVDFVVHSLKDLQTTLPEGLIIGAVMKRDDPNDTIVLKQSLRSKLDPLDLILGRGVEASSVTFKVGTSSVRRKSMIRRCNSKLECEDIRGNLNTRLAKLDKNDGDYAAIVLARAGLNRMGMSDRATCLLNPDNDTGLSHWCYAVGQGAIAVECRSGDDSILDFLSPIADLKTTYEVIAERSLMKSLGALCSAPIGCSAPLGVRSTWTYPKNESILKLESIVLSLDGQSIVRADGSSVISKNRDTANTPEFDLLTTGINVSKSIPSYPNIRENMIDCSRLGVEIANKMIVSGCQELLERVAEETART